MKSCPACNTHYSDDTLRFCLQDGTPLTPAFDTDTPTVVLDEIETAEARGGRSNAPSPVGRVTAGQPARPTIAAPAHPRSNTAFAVVLTAIGMLILFAVAGLAAWLYFRERPAVVVANLPADANSKPTPVANIPASPPPTRAPVTPASNIAEPPADPVEQAAVRSEVSSTVTSWNEDGESFDLDSYMAHYAAVVDYYNRPGASLASVRADKQRAFSRYSSININITNLSVTPDASGKTATATFDKEWDFQGGGSSSGKVRQMMRFRNVEGKWLITAEKDLKLYYKR